jgi:hypothetical protein
MLLTVVAPAYPPFQAAIGATLRRLLARRALTQSDVDDLYAPQNFDLSSRCGLFLATVFVCAVLSAPMPLLSAAAAASVGVQFWADKYFRTPPPSTTGF